MNDSGLVSVILPCFNEKGNIGLLIDAIHAVLGFCEHELVVVDDNSPDGTFEAVMAKQDPRVKAFQRLSDPSLGKSIRKGIEESSGGMLIIMDSDFNHQPKYLPQMVKNLEWYDCVSASRFLYGGMMDVRWRHLGSWFFNVWVRVLMRTYITDNLYGFYAIRREVLRSLPFDRIFWGYGDYGIRLLYYLQQQGYSVLQFPAVNGRRMAGTGNSHFFRVLHQYTTATLRLLITEAGTKKYAGAKKRGFRELDSGGVLPPNYQGPPDRLR